MNSTCRWLIACALCIAAGSPAPAAARNVLLICVDDLRPELRCFGAGYVHSPNIDRLASAGRLFGRHYVNAPSCGPSRFTLLTGRYGVAGNDALFKRAKQLQDKDRDIPPSMPEWFRRHGYTTVSVGKVSHHPGGLGGADWNDPLAVELPGAWDRQLMPSGPWQHPRGAMHGLANGKIRTAPGKHPVFESAAGDDSIYPDGWITAEALDQLDRLARGDKPFFLAVGLLKPHLPFGAPKRYLEIYAGADLPPIPHPRKPSGKTTWHGSGEFMKYQRWDRDPREDRDFATAVRLHYAACVSYADAQVGRLLQKLGQCGADKDTVVLLWGDHGWHLGEHAIWGKHTLFEEALRSPLIIRYPGLPHPGATSTAVIESLDIFPTLCELTALPVPGFVAGRSLLPQLNDPDAAGHTAVAYSGGARTIRTDRHRLTVHNKGEVELYDHRSDAGETRNIAGGQPEIVAALKQQLQQRLAGQSR